MSSRISRVLAFSFSWSICRDVCTENPYSFIIVILRRVFAPYSLDYDDLNFNLRWPLLTFYDVFFFGYLNSSSAFSIEYLNYFRYVLLELHVFGRTNTYFTSWWALNRPTLLTAVWGRDRSVIAFLFTSTIGLSGSVTGTPI